MRIRNLDRNTGLRPVLCGVVNPQDFDALLRHAVYRDVWHRGEQKLAGSVLVPDVLLQSHSAPLQLAFYDKVAFPPKYRGDAFVSLHGSWNRAKRTGPKVIAVPIEGGVPTGEYEEFMTGFVANDDAVWARPVGVAVARDGALFVSEDANGTLWRVGYVGGAP